MNWFSMSKNQRLEEILAGNPNQWSNFTATDFQNFLSSFLLPSSDYQGLLAELKRLGPRQVCQYQFKPNDIVWICRQCQKDDTCVLCNECYLGSNHDGHEVFFYHSAAGGCCDCGDCDAWSSAGFCTKHGKVHDDPTSFLPAAMRTTALEMFQLLLKNLIEFSKTCSQRSLFDLSSSQTYCLNFYYDDFHTINDFQSFYTSPDFQNILQAPPEEDLSLLQTRGFIRLRSNLTMSQISSIMPYLQNSGYTVRALSKQGECHYLATYLSLLWMESLSLACDGMCRLMGSIITSDLLHQIIRFDMYFDKQFAKSFHNLLLSLMADQPFKMTSGIAYTLAYSTLCQDYSKGYGLSGSSMFNLSVQFLNREVFVHEICYHYNFLQGAVLSLEEMIMTNSHQRGRYLNTSSPSSLELMEKQFFQSPAIIYRRYGSIVGDLKIIFVIPDICRLFASTCLSDWLVILDYLQELNPQLRSKDSHVLYEEKDWMHAFNLAIGIQSLFEYMLNWFSDVTAGSSIIKVSDSSTKQNHKTVEMISVGKVLEIIVNYVFNWQRKEKDFTPFLKDLLPIKRVKDAIFHPLGLPLSLSQSQVKSFHFPLHRFFAHVVVEVVKYPHLSDSLLQMKNILNGDLVSVMYLMKVGLRALSLSKEIECGLWRKNGVVMQHQLLNYSQPPFCRINYDLDVLLLQLTLSILPLPTFLTLYFLSFNGIAPYLFHSLHDSHYLSPFSQDMDYLPPLIAESLELLVNVVTELPPIPSEKVENRLLGKIRREWINRLAGGNTTYSQLQECLTCYPDSSKINSDELDRLLSEISTKQVINPLSPPNYTLKRDLWIEYDPCFPHIPKSLHQIAADRKPKPLKEEPMIKISPQATIHPFFLSLRDEMFFHEEFLSVLRQIFFSIARQKIAQTEVSDYHKGYFLHLLPLNDTVYSRAVQLLTLIVQSLLERKEEQSLSTSESNYETNKRKFFTFLLLETDSALEQKFPSFLRAMYDLHQVFKSSFDTRSDQYHLGWILQNCRELDSLCAEQLEMFERDSTSTIQNLHQEKVKKMEDSRSRQLGAMNEAAKKFLEMLGDVSSSDDEDENEVGKKEIKDESEEETEAGGSSLTKTGGSSLNPMDVEEDNLAEGSGKTPRKQSSGGVENESDEMNIASDVGTFTDHLCIICKIDRDDQNFVENRLGYLALIQSSSVLWPKSSATERKDNESLASSYAFHALELVPSPDKNKIQKINSCSSNAHVGFCGHLMHLDCYSRYQHTVKQKSTQQNHMIVDAELSYFPCPLCKRLCNGFFPHHTNKPDVIPPSPPLPPPPMSSTADLLTFTFAIVTPSNSHFSDPLSAMTVVNELWLNSNNLKQLYSCDRERTMILFPHMNELEGRIVWDSLIEEMFSNIENDSSRNANYPCELLTSSFAYTVAVDNSNHILPGYHLDEIQQLLQIHTSYLSEGEKGDSEKSFNIFPSLPSLFRHYLKYSPGKDEIKLFSYMILCLSEIVMLSKMETLVMNSLFHSILGKSSQLIDNHLNMEINDRFWIKYRIPALLVLPLFELIVLTSALDQLYYRQGVDMSVAGERFELIKILPWFGLAKLMQLLLPFQQQASSSAISSAKDLASFHPSLQKIFAVTMIQTMDIPSLSGKDYQKVVGEWLLFIRAVIHLHTRNTQKSVNPICTTYLQTLTNDPSLIEHFVHPITEETNITDEMIIAHAKMIGLDFILTDNWSEVAGRLVGDVMKAWMTDFGEYHHKYQRAMIASPPYPGNRTNDLLPNYYDLPEKRFYPSKGGRPHLIRLPEDYSKLHAIVASKCSFDYPVICLQCGAILNASGQGQCHAHSYSCGAGVGIFFLIQDCHIILSHGPRSCYFPSPYVDIYGEIHQQFRGKPLHLDSNRYAALEQIWLSHQIPTEVMRTRSNLNRIIINGYY